MACALKLSLDASRASTPLRLNEKEKGEARLDFA